MSAIVEIRRKAERLFFDRVSEILLGRPFSKVSILVKCPDFTGFSDLKEFLDDFVGDPSFTLDAGISIVWKRVKLFGSAQQIPGRIEFLNSYSFFSFMGRVGDYQKIIEIRDGLIYSFPELNGWACVNPSTLVEYQDDWEQVMTVLRYFKNNPPPHKFYLRELPISVHTKFIERNIKLIKRLLDIVLPDAWVNFDQSDFSARYFLRQPSIHTQVRLLDNQYLSNLKYEELSLTLEDLNTIDFVPERVFIIENRACFLSFPAVKGGIAIFGSGFRARLSSEIKWLAKSELYCWFDIDAAGFEMVNMIRHEYPHASSIIMDIRTFDHFADPFAVASPNGNRVLPLLTPEEFSVLEELKGRKNNRLEQEHISASYVYTWLSAHGFEV